MTDQSALHTRGGPQQDMSDRVFEAVSALAHREAGLLIPASKRALVQSRISRRLRALGLTDFESYLGIVEAPEGRDERRNMVSVLTTNVSSFFRESHHFETLASLAPSLVARARAKDRIRIWSAGCSSGQEPYTIAITLLESGADAGAQDIRILATDIDPAILDIARLGEYDTAQMEGVPAKIRQRYFEELPGGRARAGARLREVVHFRELNLLAPWPMKGRFDAIFCRNVVIYFDEATQARLWPRFRAALTDEGHLFVGHSERVPDPGSVGFEACGITTYRARGRGPDAADSAVAEKTKH